MTRARGQDYLTCAAVGFVTGVIALIVWAVGHVLLVFPLLRQSAATGSGGLGAVSFGISEVVVLPVFLVGFALGFSLALWRQRRLTSAPPMK